MGAMPRQRAFDEEERRAKRRGIVAICISSLLCMLGLTLFGFARLGRLSGEMSGSGPVSQKHQQDKQQQQQQHKQHKQQQKKVSGKQKKQPQPPRKEPPQKLTPAEEEAVFGPGPLPIPGQPTPSWEEFQQRLLEQPHTEIEQVKTVFDNKFRVVFFAGIEGSGHHYASDVVEELGSKGISNIQCKPIEAVWPGIAKAESMNDLAKATRVLSEEIMKARNASEAFALSQAEADSVGDARPHSILPLNCAREYRCKQTGFGSYPNFGPKFTQNNIDLVQLAHLCESLGIDLRIVYLYRDPVEMIRSVHRRFEGNLPMLSTVRRVEANARILGSMLDKVDPSFIECMSLDEVNVPDSPQHVRLAKHLAPVAGDSGSSSGNSNNKSASDSSSGSSSSSSGCGGRNGSCTVAEVFAKMGKPPTDHHRKPPNPYGRPVKKEQQVRIVTSSGHVMGVHGVVQDAWHAYCSPDRDQKRKEQKKGGGGGGGGGGAAGGDGDAAKRAESAKRAALAAVEAANAAAEAVAATEADERAPA